MLVGTRVLDLTDERGMACGQILADLGADVIAVEPPDGSPARRLGPFADEIRDPERSLQWWAYARGKRSIAIDLESTAGRAELVELVRSADVLIESDTPGTMADKGLGFADLERENPSLVYVSISPFGQDGPKARAHATDLTVWAASGALILAGDEDRAPVRVSVPQSFAHAAGEAAVGALVALHEARRSGRGQHVDVSAQQAAAAATQSGILAATVGDNVFERSAGGARAAGVRLQFTYPARDGHVSITHVFGSAIGPATARLMEWVHDCGFCDVATRDKDWVAYAEMLANGTEPIDEFERVKLAIAACTAAHTKSEMLRAALDRGLLVAPISTVRDVVESEQLAARDYLQTLECDDGRRVVYPGPFARFGSAPIRYRRRAPTLDEHGAEIRAEPRRRREQAPETRTATGSALPLEGVKILDFMWALAGPGATRTLADCGATVIRVESTTRLDVCRTLFPFRGGEFGPENSALFHNTNVGKKMISLDPNKPEGREAVLDLVRWADVVTESFSPKGMKGFGLDFDTLRKHKPDLIMLSTCLMGQTGPLAQFAGFGNLAAAVAGFYELTGWADRDPAGPFGAYTDYIAPRYNAAAVLAALEHRRKTGEGQHIDLSQVESAVHFLAPALLDFTVNGHIPGRSGNRDSDMHPHGVYRCRGDDRWVAIAVRDDSDWQALCAEIEPARGSDSRFEHLDGRLAHADELDAWLGRYTQAHTMFDVEARLQAAGIPAQAVLNSPELADDAQLHARGHFVDLPHPDGGRTTVETTRFQLSRTSPRAEGPAPTFGSDAMWVLEEVLRYDGDKIAELAIAGALE